MTVLLGVNIDHVATVRQARGTHYPSIAEAARLAERAGADSITVHLREDRRHIQDADVSALCADTQTRINLEMAVTDEMLGIALQYRPADVCLVPEKRQELTTEGGLDVSANRAAIAAAGSVRVPIGGAHGGCGRHRFGLRNVGRAPEAGPQSRYGNAIPIRGACLSFRFAGAFSTPTTWE